MGNPNLLPYETIVRATSGEPEAIDEVLRHYSKRIRLASLENGQVNKDTEDNIKRRQREISFEYLTEEKFYPFCTSDTYFIDPYKQYPVTICGQRVILTNGNLAEALSSLPEKKREIIYLYFFGRYTQQEIGELYGRCRSTAWHHIHSALQMLHEEMEVLFHEES